MNTLTSLMKEALRMPDEALAYHTSLSLSLIFPDKFILETDDEDFDLDEFVAGGHCLALPDRLSHIQFDTTWNGRELGATLSPRNGVFEILWQGQKIKIVRLNRDYDAAHFIVADSAVAAKEFFAAVCLASGNSAGKILVFRSGRFHRDDSLLKSISEANLESLILTTAIRKALEEDVENFFNSREVYQELGIPWKRGVLLMGPPGNGKTHAIKALLNRTGRAGLYVRSFAPRNINSSVHESMANVFRRARQTAPCMLIMEDLDSLIDDRNRSFLLNEMDGFAKNEGILTIATTNHPAKLDPALLHRPSRFDRKITFGLPDSASRKAYLRANSTCGCLNEEEVEKVAGHTKAFSFTYLKELCLSSQMAWMAYKRPMCDTMLSVAQTLRSQMKTEVKKNV